MRGWVSHALSIACGHLAHNPTRVRPCAARVSYPFKDAGVQDTVQLVSDTSFRPQPNNWLAGPVATLFGTAQNATAVLLQINVRFLLINICSVAHTTSCIWVMLDVASNQALRAVQGNPVLDLQNGTVSFNVSVITDPKAIKFSDGVARLTYSKAANPNQYAKVARLPVPERMLDGCTPARGLAGGCCVS